MRDPNKRGQRGLSLIELLVAITISAVLIFGTTQVYVDSRNTHDVSETAARLQEAARYAMSIMEPDIRAAGNWGYNTNGFQDVSGSASQGEAAIVTGDVNACGTNFAFDTALNMQGDNNEFVLSTSRTTGCDAYGAGAVLTADTFTTRHASSIESEPEANKAYVCSDVAAPTVYVGDTACTLESRGSALVVNTYYVSRDSNDVDGLPSLRRKSLQTGSAGPQFIDQEVMPGIEDMQIQFGIDAAGKTGNSAMRYVNPDEVPATSQVVAVRLWLLVRAETPEVGFEDGNIYAYGDRDETSTVADLNDAGSVAKGFEPMKTTDNSFTSVKNYRRLLVSRTIKLRNAYTEPPETTDNAWAVAVPVAVTP